MMITETLDLLGYNHEPLSNPNQKKYKIQDQGKIERIGEDTHLRRSLLFIQVVLGCI